MIPLSYYLFIWSHIFPYTVTLVFVLFMLFFPKWKKDASLKALFYYFLLFCVFFLVWVFYDRALYLGSFPTFDFVYILYRIILVPIFFNYIYTVSTGQQLTRKQKIWFYVPAAIFIVIFNVNVLLGVEPLLVYSWADFYALLKNGNPRANLNLFMVGWYAVSVIVISILSIIHFRRYKRNIVMDFSYKQPVNIHFLMGALVLYVLYAILSIISIFNANVFIHMSVHYLIGFLNMGLAFFAYGHKAVYSKEYPLLPDVITESIDSVFTHAQKEKMHDALQVLYERDKIWKKSDLSAVDIISHLNTNRTYFSQFLSERYGTNFRTCVNAYRVNEAQRIMRENPDINFTEIYMECGFSSYTTFNEWFKKIAGKTPTEFKEAQLLAKKNNRFI